MTGSQLPPALRRRARLPRHLLSNSSAKHHSLEVFAVELWCSLQAHFQMLPPGELLCNPSRISCLQSQGTLQEVLMRASGSLLDSVPLMPHPNQWLTT